MKRLWIAPAVVVAALAAYALHRYIHHEEAIRPAVVTQAMNVRKLRSYAGAARGGTAPSKLIALTFDDGPYPVTTPLLLAQLRALHVPATFFLIGRDAEQWPQIARQIADDGNEIADHTYSHPDLDKETPAQVRAEIRDGGRALYALTGDASVRRYFRPPHGRYTPQTLRVAQELGYLTILWTDDPGDWRNVDSEVIFTHVRENATVPEILLLHDGKLATVEMLPGLVACYRSAGYRFVTVAEMLSAVTAFDLNHPIRKPICQGKS